MTAVAVFTTYVAVGSVITGMMYGRDFDAPSPVEIAIATLIWPVVVFAFVAVFIPFVIGQKIKAFIPKF